MRKILLVLAAFIFFKAQAQTPIQVNAQLLPPYSLQVSDYYSPTASGGQKLNLILLNRDFLRSTINVRLRMVIESQGVRIATREDVTFPTVTLISGTPYYVTPAELAAYFNPNNLIFSGISQEQYTTTGKLPEGFYTFCFETVEPATGLTVSNKGCAFAWMTMSDPPFLNIPAKSETITPTNPQNIIFQWTPRHTASPTAGFSTDYVFTITEVMANDFSPESAFTSHQALYTDSTQATMYNYGISKPQLIAGKRYAWRVQAKAKQGLDNLAMFRNLGYSEVFWFDYKNNCNAPLNINAVVQGSRVTITWQAQPIYLSYKVQYREKDNASAEWFTISTMEPTVVINDLNFSKIYEYRVGASCEEESFNYSNLLSFTTGAAAVPVIANCGDSSAIPNSVAQTYLATMAVGDTILAGDFKVKILTISGSTNFTGTGTVKIPWLLGVKAAVKFTNIKVNTLKQLAVGNIETTYDPKEAGILDVDDLIDVFCAGCNVGNVVTGVAGADTTLGFPIQWPGGITAVPGPGYNPPTVNGPATITVVGVGGTPSITIVAQTLPKTIMDSTGNIYQVNNTNPITVTLIAQGGGKTMLSKTTKSLIDADKAIVKFVTYNDPKVIYAFDEWNPLYKKSGTFNKEYEKISCAGGGDCIDGGAYYVSAKAIAPGKTDYLKATVTLVDNSINPDSIQFVNGKGLIYTKKRVDSAAGVFKYEIAVVGGPEKDAQEIYALYPKSGSKTYNLGKVLVASYPKRTFKLNIVPINVGTINENIIRDSLNKIYNKINVYYEVKKINGYNNTSWDANNNGLDVKGSGFFTQLTSEMKNLNADFRKSKATNPDEIYLFMLTNASDTNVLGDMPRNRQFGYVFTQNNNIVDKVIAHEIGHGTFNLKHLKDYHKDLNDSLKNIMSYPPSTGISKYQWDLITDPALTLGLFNKDESNLYELLNEASPYDVESSLALDAPNYTVEVGEDPNYYYFYAPNGKRYKILASKISGQNVNYLGELTMFYYNNKVYKSCSFSGEKVWAGYYDTVCYKNDASYSAEKGTFSSDVCKLNIDQISDFKKELTEAQTNVKRFNEFIKTHKTTLLNATEVNKARIRELLALLPPMLYFVKDVDYDEKYIKNDLAKYKEFLEDLLKTINEEKDKLNTAITKYFNKLKSFPEFSNFNAAAPDFSKPTLEKIWNKYLNEPDFMLSMEDVRCPITKLFQDFAAIQFVTHSSYGNIKDETKAVACAAMLQSLSTQQKMQVLNIFLHASQLTSTSWNTAGPNCFWANFGEEIVVGLLRYSTDQQKVAFLDLLKTQKHILPRLYKKIDNGHFYLGGGDNFDAFVKELTVLTQVNTDIGISNENANTPIVTFNPEKKNTEVELLRWVSFDANGDMQIKRAKVNWLGLLKTLTIGMYSISGSSDFSIESLNSEPIDPLKPVALVLVSPSSTYFPQLSYLKPTDFPVTIVVPAISVAHITNKKTNDQFGTYADVAFTVITAGQMALAKNGLQFAWRAGCTVVEATNAYLNAGDNKDDLLRLFGGDIGKRDQFLKYFGMLNTAVTLGAMGEGVFDLYTNLRGSAYQMDDVAKNLGTNITQKETDILSRIETTLDDLHATIPSGANVKGKMLNKAWTFVRKWSTAFSNTSGGQWFTKLSHEGKMIARDFGNKIEYWYKPKKYAGEAAQDVKIATVTPNGADNYTFTKTNENVGNNPMDIEVAEDDFFVNGMTAHPDGVAIICKDGKCDLVNGGCFAAGTPVLTPSGLKAIETLNEGDEVMSYDSLSRKNVIEKIKYTIKKAMAFFRVIVVGKDTIIATPAHQIHTSKGWLLASAITAGTLISNSGLAYNKVDTVFTIEKAQSIYNFEVESNHNYYVGNNQLLVHNGTGCTGKLTQAEKALRLQWQLDKQVLNNATHSSRRLGSNIEKTGVTRPPNTAAHHIAAGGSTNVDAIKTRDLLKKNGIDIDEAANGVFLPKNSKYSLDEYEDAISHSRVHTDVYYQNVYLRLKGKNANEIRLELRTISDELLAGTFPYQ